MVNSCYWIETEAIGQNGYVYKKILESLTNCFDGTNNRKQGLVGGHGPTENENEQRMEQVGPKEWRRFICTFRLCGLAIQLKETL